MQSKSLIIHLLCLLHRVRYADSFSSRDLRGAELNAVLHALLIAGVLSSVEFGALSQLSLNVSRYSFDELMRRSD